MRSDKKSRRFNLKLFSSLQFVFSGPLSLYDGLRVDVEVPFYQKKVTSWEIATIDKVSSGSIYVE